MKFGHPLGEADFQAIAGNERIRCYRRGVSPKLHCPAVHFIAQDPECCSREFLTNIWTVLTEELKLCYCRCVLIVRRFLGSGVHLNAHPRRVEAPAPRRRASRRSLP